MNLINFKKAKKIFDIFTKKRELIQNKNKSFLNKFPFLIISNLFDRDFGSSEYCIKETLFNIGYKKYEIDKKFYLSLYEDQKALIKTGIFFSELPRKISYENLKYISKYYLKKLLSEFLRISVSFIDLFFIIIFAIIYIIFFGPLRKLFSQKEFKKNFDEIYTITFVKSKKINSVDYHYPDFNSRKSKMAYITNFHEFKFLFCGIVESINTKNIYNGINFINLKSLFSAIISLILVYLWDLCLLRDFSFGKLVSYLESLKFVNRKFYYLISYYSVDQLIKFKSKFFYIWSENQLHNKAISFLLSKKLNSNKKIKTKCISYIGYPYFSDFHPHLEPSFFELDNNVWGLNEFMVTNIESLNELNSSINKKGFSKFAISISRSGLDRHPKIDLQNYENIKEFNSRKLTLFSHSSINDFINMVKFLHFHKEKISTSNQETIFIRLHPTLPRKRVIKLINQLNIFHIDQFYFINSKNESLAKSIYKSQYCIFSDSNTINEALFANAKVFVFKSSFFFDPPIYKSNYRNKNLEII